MSNLEVPDILKEIITEKWLELEILKQAKSQHVLKKELAGMPACRGFARALQDRVLQNRPGVIAEIKKASPSKGVIRADFDPVQIARAYEQSGAACLSVLTDVRFFQGKNSFMQNARNAVKLPVIRKDFMIDEYQIYESRVLGADCILLIASVLSPELLERLYHLARSLGMDVLIEVHDRAEAEMALALEPELLGINNRNLRTFEVSLNATFELLEMIPSGVTVVTESGISNSADVRMMLEAGVNSFLVGESFMREVDPGEKLKAMFFPEA